MKTYFSLNQQISCEKICQKINKIVSENIKNQNDSENYCVVISLCRINDEIKVKNLENK